MLLDHTAHLPANKKLIDQVIGPEFSMFDTILMGGTGSEKMQILACSTFFKKALNNFQETNYGSIEIRPEGMIIHLNNGRRYHVWCIPYYRLAIYQTETLSIHAEGQVMKFKLKKNQNRSFIKKLIQQKAEFHDKLNNPS